MSDNINVGYVILLTHLIAENIDEDEQITFNGKTFDFSGIDGEFEELLCAIDAKARCEHNYCSDTNYVVLSPLNSQDLWDQRTEHPVLSTFSLAKVCNLRKRTESLGKRLRRLKLKIDIGKPVVVKHWDGK
jgi:hypothetical protein